MDETSRAEPMIVQLMLKGNTFSGRVHSRPSEVTAYRFPASAARATTPLACPTLVQVRSALTAGRTHSPLSDVVAQRSDDPVPLVMAVMWLAWPASVQPGEPVSWAIRRSLLV